MGRNRTATVAFALASSAALMLASCSKSDKAAENQNGGFCDQIEAAGPLDDVLDPDSPNMDIQDQADAFVGLVSVAPPVIAADVQTVADVLSSYANSDDTELDEFVTDEFDPAKFDASVDAIVQFVDTSCD